MTRRVLLRCDSTGDLYLVTQSSTISHAFLTSQYTWHQRFGHQGSEVYVVPAGRVVVPTGRYVVFAGKVINIVSPGRLSLVPTGRVLSPGRVKYVHYKGIKRDYSNARTPQQNGVAERKNRTLIEAARTMLADSKLPTMFWTKAVRTACYVLNRVLVTSPHNKTPYALLTGNIPSVSHFKPFGCHVTILNTSDHLGKFDGKADEGYIVGYSASNRAYRVYNVPNKRVEETMNLRYLEEKPNVQGLGHEWYFDLDYLTDTLGYKRDKANQSAGTQEASTNPAGTQDADSDSECDEQVIIVPSYPSHSIQEAEPKDTSGDEVDDSPLDSAEEIFQQELARLKGQEQRATSDAKDAEELQKRASTKTVPPGSIPVPTGSIPVPSGDTTISPGDVSVPTGGVPVPTGSPTDSFFDDEPTTRFPSPSDLGNNEPSPGIFSSSSYDDEFGADLNNLASTVEVSPVATKRINTIHPQSLIIGDHTSAVQTRSKVNKTTTGESAFISYIHDQQRDNHTDFQHCLFACFLSQVEPRSVAQALEDPSWVDAMQEEMQQFKFQNVWVLVDLPEGKYAIGTKWILKNKRDARGIVVRNKARLVAQGHRQEEGIDYDEVFAPVARIEAIRLFLAFASYMGFMVYQMDVKSVFLYGSINEEVYVTQPKRFVDPQYPKKVYKVVKALYGLHQAPRVWYATLSTFLLKHGYRRGTIDKTLFLKKHKREIILVQVYVDDIIFGSTKKAWCDEFEALMKGEFEMSAMGELIFFLGLQVQQRPDGIFIGQDKYVQEILKKFDLESVRTATTPYEAPKPKSKNEPDNPVNVHLYRSMIGSLMYLTASRPDIMFAVNACSRNQVTPTTSNLEAVKKIFKYLKGQPKLGLWYPSESPFVLEAYSDSDYAGENKDRKSTTGGCQFLGMSNQNLNPISKSSMAALRYRDEQNKVGYLQKPTGSDDYHQILDFLRASHIRSPELGPPAILATIDETPYTIIEDSVRSQLQLADDGGIGDLPIAKIYSGMDNLGYVIEGKLTFYKNKFLPQWRFLVYTILHCLSTKSGSWDQFGSSLVVALICLSDGRKFNWSSYIFKGMLNFEGQPMQLLAAMLPQDQEGLSSELLGADVNDEDFAERMVALINQRNRAFAEQTAKEKKNKPMTPAQQREYMRVFVKNQSTTIYSTGWSMKFVKSLSDEQLIAEFEKIRMAVADLKSLELRRTLTRAGEALEPDTSKKQKSTEAPIPFVSDVPQPPVDSSPKSSGTRRKSLGKSRITKPRSILTELDLDADDKTFIKVVSDEDSEDEAPILWSAFAGWEVISTPLGEINALYMMDQSTKHFTTLREILHMVDRQDLLKLYGLVVKYYENHHVAGAGLVLWGDLQVLMDSQEGGKGSFVWNNQSHWQIRSWRLYTLSNVHVLETVSGEVLYMFSDVSYPLSVKLMERMLKHKLEIDKDVVGNDMTTAEQLIRFIKNQLAAAQVSPA
ncbi:putative ribonuclease H-like domain-containing protein [Tanacetum coccineum]